MSYIYESTLALDKIIQRAQVMPYVQYAKKISLEVMLLSIMYDIRQGILFLCSKSIVFMVHINIPIRIHHTRRHFDLVHVDWT